MPYGPRWYAQRRLFTKEFSANLPERYEPQVQKAVSEMLGRLFRAPEDFVGHIRHMAGTVIMDVTYGIQVLPSNDPYIEEAERALVGFVSAAIPGSFWLDYFPFLKYVPSWFPGASFKVKAKNWRRDASIMVNHPYDDVKERMARGTLEPCFVYHCLQSDDLDEKRTENDGVDASKAVEVHEKDIQQTAATMYGAGTDTIVAALQSFFLTMLLNPDIQRKAQEELDRVVAKSGPERLPDFKDRESLPYITAIMYEVFRSQPVNPLGIAHLSTEDDVYKGYYIPKGSIVIGNIWAIFHDPKTYPDPNKFDPDRWVISGPTGIPEKLNPHLREPTAHFGFGRRLCAGKHLALSSIWLTIASVLFTYDISKADGESEPTGEYKSSLVNYPAPFKCKITPRSPSHEELVSLSSIDA
ncbi:hypothetical protein VKT23_014521 [Stygiomarasmius scandens]|uniref:Cytochrome P450 n=1 Tax=Marasmiellus scandens TaxID=2682957 RepID=A0ABR1J2X2_9AGAR